jgi:hypothetical protein
MDNLGMFASLVAVTVVVVELLKAKFKWVDGREELLAAVIPVVLGVAAKLAGCTAAFAQLSLTELVLGSLLAGLTAQMTHDKVIDPVVKPSMQWLYKLFVK